MAPDKEGEMNRRKIEQEMGAKWGGGEKMAKEEKGMPRLGLNT